MVRCLWESCGEPLTPRGPWQAEKVAKSLLEETVHSELSEAGERHTRADGPPHMDISSDHEMRLINQISGHLPDS